MINVVNDSQIATCRRSYYVSFYIYLSVVLVYFIIYVANLPKI